MVKIKGKSYLSKIEIKTLSYLQEMETHPPFSATADRHSPSLSKREGDQGGELADG